MGPASQGRRRMIRGGSGRLRHTAPTRVTAPGADGARLPAPWGSAPGHRPRVGGRRAGGRTGHLLAQGFGEFPEAPLQQLLVPLECKGGPEVLWAREERLGCRGAPRAQRSEPVLPRACEAGGGVGGVAGGRRCLCPAPPPKRVSDCPGSGSSGRLPFPPPPPQLPESQGSTPRDVTTTGEGGRGVYSSRGHCVCSALGWERLCRPCGEGRGEEVLGSARSGPGRCQ